VHSRELGWKFPNQAIVEKLAEEGVKFERQPELQQDAAGSGPTPDAAGKDRDVAWFQGDPDGNLLSIPNSEVSSARPFDSSVTIGK